MRIGRVSFPVLLCLGLAAGQYLETVIPLPDSLGSVAGSYHVAWDSSGRMYVAGEGGSDIIVIDVASLERVARIPTSDLADGICYNSVQHKLYCSHPRRGLVTAVDCSTNAVTATIEVGRTPRALVYCPSNDQVYCANFADSCVTAIDCSADTVKRRIPVDSSWCFGLCPELNKLYVGTGTRTVVLDCATDSIIAALPELGNTQALCYNPTSRKVYAAS